MRVFSVYLLCGPVLFLANLPPGFRVRWIPTTAFAACHRALPRAVCLNGLGAHAVQGSGTQIGMTVTSYELGLWSPWPTCSVIPITACSCTDWFSSSDLVFILTKPIKQPQNRQFMVWFSWSVISLLYKSLLWNHAQLSRAVSRGSG